MMEGMVEGFEEMVEKVELEEAGIGFVWNVRGRWVRSEDVMVVHRVSKFDVRLHVFEEEDQLWMDVEYNRDLFDEERIDGYMNYYVHLVDGMRGEAEGRFYDYWLMEKGEEAGMMIGKKETGTGYRKGRIE
uniref:condensation domain-containing protein n=1 Tax=Bacillus pumilus TaxID=1408 RepID=UPI0011A59431